MKRIERALVTHACGVCSTEYRSKARAKECDSRPVEKPVFKVGTPVRILEKRECKYGGKYTAEGVVVKVSRPLPPDQEYELKWLGGKSERLTSHVRQYFVAYTCPHCSEKRKHPVFAPEIVALTKEPRSKKTGQGKNGAIDKRVGA